MEVCWRTGCGPKLMQEESESATETRARLLVVVFMRSPAILDGLPRNLQKTWRGKPLKARLGDKAAKFIQKA
jgi:hypothetical protein